MTVAAIPREAHPGETRVAATPETTRRLVALGLTVLVERGAGAGAHHPDAAYRSAGGAVVDDPAELLGQAEVVLKVHPPGPRREGEPDEAALLREQALLVSFLWPARDPRGLQALAARRITALAMERIPRITRAQGMDALSSQSNIAGYKAALLAASAAPKLFPLLMTAAGTITPARVVVLGAGVAGLQAVATCRRLGAVVEVSDVRRAVKEQVESLGARFIEVEGSEDLEGAGGYAREAPPELLARQQELVRQHIVSADAVITTALVPDRPAPRLVTAEMVGDMRAGAVIVDLAVEQGGNCELSVAGQTVQQGGVTIIGLRDLPALLPVHASEMYARNLVAVLTPLLGDGGALRLDLDDEINDAAVVLHQGRARHDDVRRLLERPGG